MGEDREEVVVIGGGPAGLQAALTLGRMHRRTVLLDSGEYRNGPVLHMHNLVGNDGTPPAEFRATARAQLEPYASVRIRQETATTIARDGDAFRVSLADGGSILTGRVLLATGMKDDLPTVPGLESLWGVRAFSCPFCDGHEYTGRTVGLLGASARTAHVAGLLRPVVGSLRVFPLEGDDPSVLDGTGLEIHPHEVTAVREEGDGVQLVTSAGSAHVDGLFVTAGSARQRAPFAEQLGLRMLDSGAVEIDDFGRTSEPGIFAAGDLAHRASLPGVIASVAAASAAGMLAGVAIVQELAAE